MENVHLGAPKLLWVLSQRNACMEFISYCFSLEISIITKPPIEKRLSKNARHLSPQSPPG